MKLIRALTTLALILASSANAELIQWDAFSEGDNAAVKDSETGLVWLDLNQTAGINYYDVLDGFSGWTYASTSQVEDLVTNFFGEVFFQSGNLAINSQQRFGEFSQFQESCYATADSHSELDLVEQNGKDYAHDRAQTDPACFLKASKWGELFGTTVQSEAVFYNRYSFGLYGDDVADENGFSRLRMAGAYLNGGFRANVYGTEYLPEHNNIHSTDNGYLYSSFLVKVDQTSTGNDDQSDGSDNGNSGNDGNNNDPIVVAAGGSTDVTNVNAPQTIIILLVTSAFFFGRIKKRSK